MIKVTSVALRLGLLVLNVSASLAWIFSVSPSQHINSRKKKVLWEQSY